jgi:hypothetical protein
MKYYITGEAKEYKIVKVADNLVTGFEAENQSSILTQGNSIMEVLLNFEKLNLPPNGMTPMKEEKKLQQERMAKTSKFRQTIKS